MKHREQNTAGLLEEQVPAIIVPIFANTYRELLSQARACYKRADILEWRLDLSAEIFQIDNTWEDFSERNFSMLKAIFRDIQMASEASTLATLRTVEEGGEARVSPQKYREVVLAAARCTQLVDVQVSHPVAETLVNEIQGMGNTVFGSYHDFHQTPETSFLVERFRLMENMGVDVAKVAVRVHTLEDLLKLLGAVTTSKLPTIPVPMGTPGAPVRLMGGAFGSVATFASLEGRTTAPGQFELSQVQECHSLLHGPNAARRGWSIEK